MPRRPLGPWTSTALATSRAVAAAGIASGHQLLWRRLVGRGVGERVPELGIVLPQRIHQVRSSGRVLSILFVSLRRATKLESAGEADDPASN